jgi:hypothetical protein
VPSSPASALSVALSTGMLIAHSTSSWAGRLHRETP